MIKNRRRRQKVEKILERKASQKGGKKRKDIRSISKHIPETMRKDYITIEGVFCYSHVLVGERISIRKEKRRWYKVK